MVGSPTANCSMSECDQLARNQQTLQSSKGFRLLMTPKANWPQVSWTPNQAAIGTPGC